MDRWLPHSSEGAFERFLTAAIATIITIMFSWRMLDKVSEESSTEDEEEPRRPRRGGYISSSLSPVLSQSSAKREVSAVGSVSARTPTNNGNGIEKDRDLSSKTAFSNSSEGEGSRKGVDCQICKQTFRAPVDFPLCGDNQNDITCARAAKISALGETSGIPVNSGEELWSVLWRDNNNGDTNTRLSDCSIDPRTPGARAQTHAGAATMHRPLSQLPRGLESQHGSDRACVLPAHHDRSRFNDLSLLFQTQHRRDFEGSIADSCIDDINVDLFADKSDNGGVDNNADCCSSDFIIDHENRSTPEHGNTTDGENFDDEKDDDATVSSEYERYEDDDEGEDDFCGEEDNDDDDAQPRELDSDEELFCCSILEPIIEEDSDDMTTSSEGDSKSERGLNSNNKNTVIESDIRDDERNTPVGESLYDSTKSWRDAVDSVYDSTNTWTDDHNISSKRSTAAITRNSEQRPVLEIIKSRTPDLENRAGRLNETNVPLAAGPDYYASDGGERSSHPLSSGRERAQFEGLNDCGVGEAVFPRDEYSEYIRNYGTNIDRVTRSVNVRTLKSSDNSDSDNEYDHTALANEGVNFSQNPEANRERFVVNRFVHTFSTRVECEDSNSDSDESVQTVISRQLSREFDLSPGHAQGVSLRPTTPSSPKRHLDEARSSSSPKRKKERDFEHFFGQKQVSERVAGSFHEKINNFSNKQKCLPDPSIIVSDYDSANILNSLPSNNTGITQSKGESTTSNVNYEKVKVFPRDSNELRSSVSEESNFVKGKQFHDPKQRAQHSESLGNESRCVDSDSFVTSCSEEPFGNIDTPLCADSVLSEFPFLSSVASTPGNELVSVGEMDSKVYYPKGDFDGFGDGEHKRDSSEDEWVTEVVETYVFPISSAMGSIQPLTDFIDQRNFAGGSRVIDRGESDADDEACQSTCTATMVEVDGYDATGFLGNDDISSGYRDQVSVLAGTDRYLKQRMGFQLNLDEFKSDDYVTESGFPIVRFIENERVYIDERGLDKDDGSDIIEGYRESDVGEDSQRVSETGDIGEDLQRVSETGDIGEDLQRVSETGDVGEDLQRVSETGDVGDEETKSEIIETEHPATQTYLKNQIGTISTKSHQFRPYTHHYKDELEQSYFQRHNPSFSGVPTQQFQVRHPQTWVSGIFMDDAASMSSATREVSGNIILGRQADEGAVNILATNVNNNPFTDWPSDNFSHAGVSTITNPFVESQRKRLDEVDTFTKDIPSARESVSNYDEFIRFMSSKDDRSEHKRDLQDFAPAILSGNVNTSFNKQEKSPSGIEVRDSQSFFSTFEDIEVQDQSQVGESSMTSRLVRTSTEQDDDDGSDSDQALQRKNHAKRSSQSSTSDGSSKSANSSFEEKSERKLVLERSYSEHGGSGEPVRQGLVRIKSRESLALISPTDELSELPESARQFRQPISPGQSLRDVVLETSPKRKKNSAPVACSITSSSSSSNSITTSTSVYWTSSLPGSNVLEERISIRDESATSEEPLDMPDGEQRTSSAADKFNESAGIKESSDSVPITLIPAEVWPPLQTYPSATSNTSTITAKQSMEGSKFMSRSGYDSQKYPDSNSAVSVLDSRPNNTNIFLNSLTLSLAMGETRLYTTDPVAATTGFMGTLQEKRQKDSDETDSENSESESDEMENSNEGDATDEEDEEEEDERSSSLEGLDNETESRKNVSTRESVHELTRTNTSSASSINISAGSTAANSTTNTRRVPLSLPSRGTSAGSMAANSTTNTRRVPLSLPSRGTNWAQFNYNTGSSMKPKSMKEIKKRQKQPYKSILTQDITSFPAPKAAPFVLPDHMLTPSRLKIIQSRNKFLSEENLLSDSFTSEFESRKETLVQPTAPTSTRDRKYIPRMSRHSNYRSQEQLEKIMHMISLKPGRSEGSLQQADCLHDDCILSEKGRREILDKTLSIDNLHTDLNKYMHQLGDEVDGGQTGDSFFPETNNDLFDLTFPFQDEPSRNFDRPVSMGELRHASDYSTISGAGTGLYQGFKANGSSAQKNNKVSRSLCALDDNTEDVNFTGSTDSLQRPPSAHDLRISKSLQKLNVPDWYKQSYRSKSTGSLLNYCSSPSVMSWGRSHSVVSSPRTTPSSTSNVVIKSRVQFPTSSRNLRSPRFSSKSAPSTPSIITDEFRFTSPVPIQLPSEKMRASSKPLALMPIPIVPFDTVRAKLEKNKGQANTIKAAQNLPSSSSSSFSASKLQAALPSRVSQPDSISLNNEGGKHNVEEGMPKIVTSPTDPNVRSILKRSNHEKGDTETQELLNLVTEEVVIRPVQVNPLGFNSAMTLFTLPTVSGRHEAGSQQQQPALRYGTRDKPVPAERPRSKDFTPNRKTKEEQRSSLDANDIMPQDTLLEEERNSLPVLKPRIVPRPFQTSFIPPSDDDIQVDCNSPNEMRDESSKSHSGDSSCESSDRSPVLQTQANRYRTFVSDIREISEEIDERISDFPRNDQDLPEEKDIVLEGVHIMKTQTRRPSLAPVISDLSIEDDSQHALYYGEPLNHAASWDTQSLDSVSDTHQSYNVPPTIPQQEPEKFEREPQKKRTWVPKSKLGRTVKSPEIPEKFKDSKSIAISGLQPAIVIRQPSNDSQSYQFSDEYTPTSDNLWTDNSNKYENYSQPYSYPDSKTEVQYFSHDSTNSKFSARFRQTPDEYIPPERKTFTALDRSVTEKFFQVQDQYNVDGYYQEDIQAREVPDSSESLYQHNRSHDNKAIRHAVDSYDHDDHDYGQEYENQDESPVYERQEISFYRNDNRDYGRIEVYEVQGNNYTRNENYDKTPFYDNNMNTDGDYVDMGTEQDWKSGVSDREDISFHHDQNWSNDKDLKPSRESILQGAGMYDLDHILSRSKNRNSVSSGELNLRSQSSDNYEGRTSFHHDRNWSHDEDTKPPRESNLQVEEDYNLDNNFFSRNRDRNSVSSRELNHRSQSSDNYEDRTASRTSLSSGRTWQPKPRKSRRSGSASPRRVRSPDRQERLAYKPSLDSNGISAEASPYKYKVEGSAFSSSKPDARAGISTPPAARRREFDTASISSSTAEGLELPCETAV